MSHGWRTCTRGNECPICGSDHYCSIADSGDVVQCSLPKRQNETADAPDGWSLWKPTKEGGMLYRRLGSDGKPIKGEALTPEAKRKREEQEAYFKAKSAADALESWRRAAQFKEQTKYIGAYLYARGVDVRTLIEGLPKSLRFDPQCPDIALVPGITKAMAQRDGGEPRKGVRLAWPAMVAAISDANGELAGIHRTFFGLEAFAAAFKLGQRPLVMPRKRREIDHGVTGTRIHPKTGKATVGPMADFGAARKMLGEVKGHAVRLGRTFPNGILILAEGIETSLACMAGTGCTAWACLSSQHMMEVVIPPAIVDQGLADRVTTIIIAEDLDSKGQGGDAAAVLASRLAGEYPWLTIKRAAPTHQVCPELVKPENTPRDKKVDWLDVLNSVGKHNSAGVERVRIGLIDLATTVHTPTNTAPSAATLHSTPPTPPTGGMPRNAVGTRTDDQSGGGEGGQGSSGGDDGFDSRADLYRPEPEQFRPLIANGALNQAHRYLVERCMIPGASRFAMARWNGKWWRYADGAYREISEERLRSLLWSWLSGFSIMHRDKRIPFDPKPDDVKAVLAALAIDTVIDGDVPSIWLNPTIIDGRPQWGRAAAEFDRTMTARDGRRADLCLVFPNGILDVGELLRSRKVVMHPHTPDLFTTTLMPYELPVEPLQRLIDGADQDGVYSELCPNFWDWIADASSPDGDEMDMDWQNQLQIMLGDTVTGDRSIEKIFLVVGKKRAGKGILGVVLETVLGAENIASINSTLLSDKFGPSSLIGKRAALWPDAHIANFDDGGAIVETLKSIRGRDRLPMRDLYGPYSTARINARIWITANEELDLRDDSGALAGSMIILPMRKSAAGRENEDLKDLIAAEGPGLMVFALEGAVRLWSMKPRMIPVCSDGREVQEQYAGRSAHIEQFVKEVIKRSDDPEVSTSQGDVYLAYEWWCEHVEHRKAKGRGAFFTSVNWHLPKTVHSHAGESKRKRRYPGVFLADEVRDAISKANTRVTEWGNKDDGLLP